jgi:hypothetical protein
MANEDSAWFRFLTWFGRMWGKVESGWGALRARLRRRRRQLRAEARILSAEVLQLGVQIWDRVDDLPFVPSSFKLRPIRTQYYGHGAFMGAAPALLADPRWRRILAFLMPDVFEQVRDALAQGADPPRIIPMMENNPVLAAFGVFRGADMVRADDESPHHLTGIEWDLFLDADLLADWARARGNDEALAGIMARVIDTGLIAHATAADTVQESMGICQYRDVRKTPKTGLGGVEVDSWLDLFGRALYLAKSEDLAAALTEMNKDPRSDSEEECMRNTFAPVWPVRRCVDVYREITGKPWLSVIIDIKSLRSSPEFLSDLVRALNTHGVHVAAVASFLLEEVQGVSATTQSIDGTVYPPPREIQFFHFAGDLQEACDEGHVLAGQSVMFNGASLLDSAKTDAGWPVYSTKLRVLSELEEYRARFDLHVGIYVQEGDCDHKAASLLSDLSEARPETFELGFAWGGLRDESHLADSRIVRLGYGSQRRLEYVGQARQWRLGKKS